MGLPLPSVLDEALAQRARHRWPQFLIAASGRPGVPLAVETGIPRDLVRERQAGPFRSVLACVGFSDVAGQVLDDAVSIAAQHNAALHVIHVHSDSWRGAGPPAEIARDMPDFAARYRAAVEKRVRALGGPFVHEFGALRPEYYRGPGRALRRRHHRLRPRPGVRPRRPRHARPLHHPRLEIHRRARRPRVLVQRPRTQPPGFDGRAPNARFAHAEPIASRDA